MPKTTKEKIMEVKEVTQHVKWVGWYLFNVSVIDIFKAVYGKMSDGYKAEKEDMFYASRMEWFLNLDSSHQERVIEASIKKYQKRKK